MVTLVLSQVYDSFVGLANLESCKYRFSSWVLCGEIVTTVGFKLARIRVVVNHPDECLAVGWLLREIRAS